MAKNSKLITAANFKDFDWNKAKLFYHVAKCGSFTKAARLAGTDRTTLTRQIQLLEQQIGSDLLVRKTGIGNIMLTRKGQLLLEKVAPFFLEMKGFCGNHHIEIKGEKRRKIRISTTHAIAAYIIGDFLLDYTKINPEVSFEIIADDYIMDIILNDADIAIQPLDPRFTEKKTDGIQYEFLFSVEKKLYASDEYIKTYGEPKTVDELINHHIVAFPQPEVLPQVNWILTLGLPEGKLHNPTYTSNSIENLINAAKKGIGIIGSYEEYSIIRNSNLINILPHVKDKPFKEYFIYPDYLKEDEIILDIRNYLKIKLNS
jgi:DNA-binding transcriptional LysR family regulator